MNFHIPRQGQTIALRGGVYRPTAGVVIATSGEPTGRITISNYRDERPMIDAALVPDNQWMITQRTELLLSNKDIVCPVWPLQPVGQGRHRRDVETVPSTRPRTRVLAQHSCTASAELDQRWHRGSLLRRWRLPRVLEPAQGFRADDMNRGPAPAATLSFERATVEAKLKITRVGGFPNSKSSATSTPMTEQRHG